jgi:CRP/FNR family transcriptional regulator, anaerobic regulatory protein
MRNGLSEASFPFFARLGVAARAELGALSSTRARPTQQLLRRGAPVRGVYLVVAGSLRVYYLNAEGREATLYRVEPGGTCILALTSAFSEEPYPAWVDAGNDGCSYIQISSAAARRLLSSEPAFRDYIFAALSGRIFELMQTLEEAGSTRVVQRLARYIVRRMDHDSVLRTTQAGIASELGTAREVVSRALRALSARGLVKTARGRLEVSDPKALRALADLSDHDPLARPTTAR